MPDISELNGTAIDNVAEFDGLTVSGGVPSATEPYVAYSVRKLGSTLGITYSGPCLRARRVSDGVEADVEFDGDVLSLSSAISNTSASENTFGDFVGHGGTPTDAIVTVWYDQTSTGIDMEDRVVSQAFQIYDASNGLPILNGKPFLDGTHQSFTFLKTVSSVTTTTSAGYYVVADHASSASSRYCIAFATGSEGLRVDRYFPSTENIGYGATGQFIFSGHTEGTAASVYLDNALENSLTLTTTPSVGTNTLNIGMRGPYFDTWDGNIQEFIFYNGTSIADRAVITGNQNSFFGVY